MATTQKYLDLITSEYQGQPKFMAMIALSVSASVRVQNLMESFATIFDLNLAVGDQLDIIGKWVGISRLIAEPISGVYFAWDDISNDGWDFGIWQGPFDPITAIVSLPDDVYCTLIKGKIAANTWDGSIPAAYEVWAILFPELSIIIQDNQDMTMTFGVLGGPIDSLTQALLFGGYIPLKPEGVRVNYIVSVDTNPLFAWDTNTPQLQGWDSASWAMEL